MACTSSCDSSSTLRTTRCELPEVGLLPIWSRRNCRSSPAPSSESLRLRGGRAAGVALAAGSSWVSEARVPQVSWYLAASAATIQLSKGSLQAESCWASWECSCWACRSTEGACWLCCRMPEISLTVVCVTRAQVRCRPLSTWRLPRPHSWATSPPDTATPLSPPDPSEAVTTAVRAAASGAGGCEGVCGGARLGPPRWEVGGGLGLMDRSGLRGMTTLSFLSGAGPASGIGPRRAAANTCCSGADRSSPNCSASLSSAGLAPSGY
mmetsp:Transcript_31907/g.43554  ORF Transcript_31907/g.43554 Transcript_31907/m.43554 type:complete len:266 (-) Transcript_31907:1322-2119(-)